LDADVTVASFVISGLALVVACIAAWYARRQTRAAEHSAAEARRSADAAAEMTQIEQDRRATEIAEADRNRVRFALDHERGQVYWLRNVGTDTAYGVHVDTEGLGTAGEVEDIEEFSPDDAYRYFLSLTLDCDGTERVVVTWHHRQDRSDQPRSVRLSGP
jgi:hypothetical protein